MSRSIRPAVRERGVERVVLGIRPEAFEEASFGAAHLPRIQARVEVVEELGADAHVFFTVDAAPVAVEVREEAEAESLLTGGATLFTARVDPGATVRVGEPVSLTVDPARFHFFDVVSGASLVGSGTSRAASPPVIATT